MGLRTCPNCLEPLSLTDSHALKCSLCGFDLSTRNQTTALDAVEPIPAKLTREEVSKEFAEKKSKMRKKFLYMGYQMGFDTPRTAAEQSMERWQINMARIDAWALSDRSKIRKKLNDMTYQELVLSLTQFELVFKDFKKRV